MKTALISLSKEGAQLINILAKGLPDTDVFIHKDLSESYFGTRFESIVALSSEIFDKYGSLVYVAPCGVVLRAIALKIKDKHTDPAVVVVDVLGRYVISLLSGHEGGANELAMTVANILEAEPVITTTTEALKTLIIGIGCRKGVKSQAILEAVQNALDKAGADLSEVRLLASVDIKKQEKGLIEAAQKLNIPIRYISSEEIRSTSRRFTHSKLVQEKIHLPAVAEPASLLAGRRTRLILPKTILGKVTIAIAKESSLLSV